MTFATLGNIVFSTLQSWQTFESKRGFKYAQHDVVEAPPRLQAIARELQELTFTIILHAIMGNPETSQQQLEDAMDAHKAMPLVLGNGTHLGSFVIVELTTTAKKYAADGSIIAIEMRAQLKEYVAGASADPNAPPQPTTTPPALVEADGRRPGSEPEYRRDDRHKSQRHADRGVSERQRRRQRDFE